ncbi:MAG: sigma-70 family RNA polymerase sigma factor [Planctomycetes bacterium]|nr:sigma-70 family RNA polymerase sigma factor [Planctomycetota bacterium]
MKDEQVNEKELLDLTRQGGEPAKEAMAKLYELYHGYVEKEARRCLYSTEDLDEFTQEVWKRVVDRIQFYKGDSLKGLLGKAYFGGGKPQGIIGNYYLEFIRAKSPGYYDPDKDEDDKDDKPWKRIKIHSLYTPIGQAKDDFGGEKTLYLIDIIPAGTGMPMDFPFSDEAKQVVREEVQKLPKMYRYVVLMKYFDGRSCQEIAELLNISCDDVRQRLSRSYDKLKEQLIERMIENPVADISRYMRRKHNKNR